MGTVSSGDHSTKCSQQHCFIAKIALRSLADFNFFSEAKHSLDGSIASLIEEMELQEASSRAPSVVKNDSTKYENNLCLILHVPNEEIQYFERSCNFDFKC